MRTRTQFSCALWLCSFCALAGTSARGAFQLDLQLADPTNQFSPVQTALLNTAMVQAETVWNTVLTGYQPGIVVGTVAVSVHPISWGLAFGGPSGTTTQGGYTLATSGTIQVNVHEVENFANWQGDEPNGLNFLDELLVHEAGHVLGLGTLWTQNGVYAHDGTYRYTGQYGLAAYRAEFDATAAYVPVENAGGAVGAHWDQRMRSSVEEGDPENYWPLDPRVGVADAYGRDRALEVLTGAIDPDYREPFLARFTVESMRDLGYTVAAFEDFNGDGTVGGADLGIWKAHFGATGLEMDGLAMGDADRDRAIGGRDFLLWQRMFAGGGSGATGVPEPGGAALVGAAVAGMGLARRRN